MTTNTNFQHITRAEAETLETSSKFDVVRIMDRGGNVVCLFLPAYTGQDVAAVINAAVAAKGGE